MMIPYQIKVLLTVEVIEMLCGESVILSEALRTFITRRLIDTEVTTLHINLLL